MEAPPERRFKGKRDASEECQGVEFKLCFFYILSLEHGAPGWLRLAHEASSGALKNIRVLKIMGFPRHHLPIWHKQDWKIMSNKMQTNHWISCRKSLEILGFHHCG